MITELKYTAPERAGVPPEALRDFLAALDDTPIDMHSVILLRGDNILLETYYEPFAADSPHRMYSITKSFVSLAVGALAAEGRISLDDNIVKYFPEYPSPYSEIRRTTIRDMLMMRSPHDYTTYKQNPQMPWVESFFTTRPTHEPGTVFAYDTSSAHVLGALVEKLSGMTLTDYLRGVCLDEIGFSKEAYCLKDPQGVSIGGSGLMAKPMDIARTARLVMNGGRCGERRLLDGDYLRTATSCLSPSETRGSFADNTRGYGMMFWRTRHNGYMMYGMAGQLALCLPDKDIILVTTADSMTCRDGAQLILGAFWRLVYSRIDTEPAGGGAAEPNRLTARRRLPVTAGAGREFSGGYVFSENKLGLRRLSVKTDERGGELRYENRDGEQLLRFGTGFGEPGAFPRYGCLCVTDGAWVEEDRLVVKSRLIGEMIGSVTLELYFSDGFVTVSARKTEGHYFDEYNGVASGRRVIS